MSHDLFENISAREVPWYNRHNFTLEISLEDTDKETVEKIENSILRSAKKNKVSATVFCYKEQEFSYWKNVWEKVKDLIFAVRYGV